MPTINYRMVAKKNPVTKEVRYYAQKSHYGISRIDTSALVDYIAENSQLPRAVLPSALAAIQKSINNFVLNGHSVTVPRLGTFTATLRSEGAETVDGVTGDLVKGIRVKFRPTSAMLEQLRYGISYNKVK